MNLTDRIKWVSVRTLMGGMLFILALSAMTRIGAEDTWRQFLIAPASAVFFELIFRRLSGRTPYDVRSALISGLIIALVLQPGAALYIPVFAAFAAIGSKYAIRFDSRHVFNPANLGLLLSGALFGAYFFWWGAEVTWLVILLGALIALRYRRLHLVLIFLAVQFLVLGIHFRSLGAAALMINYFFVFVMLVEPKTSPIRKNGRLVYGALTSLIASLLIIPGAAFDPWLLSLFIANITVPLINRVTYGNKSGN